MINTTRVSECRLTSHVWNPQRWPEIISSMFSTVTDDGKKNTSSSLIFEYRWLTNIPPLGMTSLVLRRTFSPFAHWCITSQIIVLLMGDGRRKTNLDVIDVERFSTLLAFHLPSRRGTENHLSSDSTTFSTLNRKDHRWWGRFFKKRKMNVQTLDKRAFYRHFDSCCRLPEPVHSSARRCRPEIKSKYEFRVRSIVKNEVFKFTSSDVRSSLSFLCTRRSLCTVRMCNK